MKELNLPVVKNPDLPHREISNETYVDLTAQGLCLIADPEHLCDQPDRMPVQVRFTLDTATPSV